MSEILVLEDSDWKPSRPGEQLRIQVVWVRATADAGWVEAGGWRYGPGDEDVNWAQVRVRTAALPGTLAANPRRGGFGAELIGYHDVDRGDTDRGPRRLRVDIVDLDTRTTVASLTPGEALALVSEVLTAVMQAREHEKS